MSASWRKQLRRRVGCYSPRCSLFPAYALCGVDEDASKLKDDGYGYLSERLDILLRYVYAGRERDGWDFFERAYARADRAEMRKKITAELRSQPLYKLLYGRAARR